jgi:colanic acid biosynthesis glycosyl transferase WcaI
MLRDLVNELREQGHRVDVLFGSPGQNSPAAFGSWLRFWIKAMIGIATRSWDRCVVMTDPPFLSWSAALLGKKRPIYCWVMDLYPGALVSSGLITPNGLVARSLQAISKHAGSKLAGMICLGHHQSATLRLSNGITPDDRRVIVVEPWDLRPLPKPAHPNLVRAQYGLGSKKIALYAGNLGEPHLFEPIVAAARCFADSGDTAWHFVFAVRGSRASALRTAATTLPNVLVVDYVEEQLANHLLWAADVHLLTLRRQFAGVCVPSRIYAMLKTNSSILFIGPDHCDTANVLRQADAGYRLDPETKGSLVAAKIQELAPIKRQPAEASNGSWVIAKFVTAMPT